MLIALISDTHAPRFAARLPKFMERLAAARPDAIAHCGDFTTLDIVAPFERIAPFEAVAGNNDGPDIVRRFGRRKIVEFAGARIGLVHGDGERGTTLERARAAFAPGTVDAIFFGHSHVPYCAIERGVWLVNPGSPTDKRRQAQFSFALVDVAEGRVAPQLVRFGP